MVKRKDTIARSVQDLKDRAGRLPTGVEGANVPENFSIPAATIEDVDRAIFNLFDKRLNLEVRVDTSTIKVPAVFAGSERVFMSKGHRPPVDTTGAFILPIVSIRRTGLDQSKPGMIMGRGMGQNTGDLVIKKRLSSKDPKYQALVNRLNISNQNDIASSENRASDSEPVNSRPGTVASRRYRRSSFNTITGQMMSPELGNNIFEVITMPFPHFYTALYEITVWTQYTTHMNAIIERFMTSYDAQGNQFQLNSDKGYWFVAYVDDDLTSADNFTDYTEGERFVKYKFNIKVPAYLHGQERHGIEKPFRSFLSAPQISFELIGGSPPVTEKPSAPVGSGDIDKFTLSDVQILDKRGDPVEDERQVIQSVSDTVRDPFSGKTTERYVRVLTRNQRKGETMLSKRTLTIFDDINI